MLFALLPERRNERKIDDVNVDVVLEEKSSKPES
jgi:hypothetical protein